MEQFAILVADDEEPVRTYLSEVLGAAGYQVRTATTGAQALEMLSGGSFDAVLLDIALPDLSGLEVLGRYRAAGGRAKVVVLSALQGADDVVRAMRLGATDYLSKPFDLAELEASLARSLGKAAGVQPNGTGELPPFVRRSEPVARAAPASPEPSHPEPVDDRAEWQLVSSSPAMLRARELVDRIADTDVPVLLLGESGTGKEVIAREIHARSRRRSRPFIKVNCAALPSELLESELFGHERGAFTGATGEKPGKFELADRGTIFLDEIGEIAIRLQAKLLQVLQDEEFYRVGGRKSVKVDSRVVVATNRDLEREIELGNFRADLFYRLNVVAIRVAPLRDRREDIAPLVEHFLRKYGRRYRHGLAELPPEVLKAFSEYAWPGNVRELENMVRRLVVLRDPVLVLEELSGAARQSPPAQVLMLPEAVKAPAVFQSPFAMPQPPPPPPVHPPELMSLKDIGRRAAMLAEREAILAMLQRTAWNKRKAATRLRISYKALLYKIKGSGIVDPRATVEP
ncbi:MAG: sigma-54-dependent transcriptional regulator [Myxococcaceae bacterium]